MEMFVFLLAALSERIKMYKLRVQASLYARETV